jgi:hypothetical protein
MRPLCAARFSRVGPAHTRARPALVAAPPCQRRSCVSSAADAGATRPRNARLRDASQSSGDPRSRPSAETTDRSSRPRDECWRWGDRGRPAGIAMWRCTALSDSSAGISHPQIRRPEADCRDGPSPTARALSSGRGTRRFVRAVDRFGICAGIRRRRRVRRLVRHRHRRDDSDIDVYVVTWADYDAFDRRSRAFMESWGGVVWTGRLDYRVGGRQSARTCDGVWGERSRTHGQLHGGTAGYPARRQDRPAGRRHLPAPVTTGSDPVVSEQRAVTRSSTIVATTSAPAIAPGQR